MFEEMRKQAALEAEEALQQAAEARLRRLLITEACTRPFPGQQPALWAPQGRGAAGVRCVDVERLRREREAAQRAPGTGPAPGRDSEITLFQHPGAPAGEEDVLTAYLRRVPCDPDVPRQ